MKRSPALASLSRDHHHALEAALRLRRATDESLGTAAEAFAAFFEPRGRRHFEIEEDLLLGALPEGDPQWGEATERVREEHTRIRALAASLADARELPTAHALGQLLHDHVRFEERRLFAMLEERLPEDALVRLGDAIHAAEQRRSA